MYHICNSDSVIKEQENYALIQSVIMFICALKPYQLL
jgi:hypothetical protein